METVKSNKNEKATTVKSLSDAEKLAIRNQCAIEINEVCKKHNCFQVPMRIEEGGGDGARLYYRIEVKYIESHQEVKRV